MRFICYIQKSLLSGSGCPRCTFANQNGAVDMCEVSLCGLDSGATSDADMLNPVGFSEKMKATMGMPNLPDRSVTCTQLVLHRDKDSP